MKHVVLKLSAFILTSVMASISLASTEVPFGISITNQNWLQDLTVKVDATPLSGGFSIEGSNPNTYTAGLGNTVGSSKVFYMENYPGIPINGVLQIAFSASVPGDSDSLVQGTYDENIVDNLAVPTPTPPPSYHSKDNLCVLVMSNTLWPQLQITCAH